MSYEMLLSPMSIGKMTVKNRLVMTPAETSMGDMTGKATERLISYYEERAKGGVGLIITATTRVNDLDSASTFNQLAMSHDYHIEPARRLAERIHSHGAKICVQLHHAGRQGYSISTYALPALIPLTKAVPAVKDLVWKSTDMLYKLEEKGLYLPALAPSACEPSYHVFNRVVGMSKRHIKKLERDFIDAAERCQKAGIDGVELHAAHGYLMELGGPDENGRRKSVGTGKYETLKVDCVISAIGQVVDWGALDTGAMRKRPKGTAEADAVTYQTAEPDIFVGGDAYTGPHFAIDAIAAGREGAISLHRFVQEGQSLTLARNPRDFCELDKGDIVLPLGSFDVPARQRPAVDESKIKTFRDEREPFTEEQVRLEASRCLGCGGSDYEVTGGKEFEIRQIEAAAAQT